VIKGANTRNEASIGTRAKVFMIPPVLAW